MKLVVEIEFDEARADAYNASLYEPALDDPVQGNGRDLVRDVARDALEDLLGDGDWHGVIVGRRMTLDGVEIAL